MWLKTNSLPYFNYKTYSYHAHCHFHIVFFFSSGSKISIVLPQTEQQQGKTTGQANMVSRAVNAEIKLQFLFCTYLDTKF